jgi:hypothetical protein
MPTLVDTNILLRSVQPSRLPKQQIQTFQRFKRLSQNGWQIRYDNGGAGGNAYLRRS